MSRKRARYPIIDDQSRNGVKVIVRRWPSGTTVEADCGCFGGFRAHTNIRCPRLLAAKRTRDKAGY